MSLALTKLTELLGHTLVCIPHGTHLNFTFLPQPEIKEILSSVRDAWAKREFTVEQLRKTITAWLMMHGRDIYDHETKRSDHQDRAWPDHVSSPVILAWYIKFGPLTWFKKRLILFDHGKTHLTFMKEDARWLLERITQQILREDYASLLPPTRIWDQNDYHFCSHD